MAKLLVVQASPRGNNSISRKVTDTLVQKLRAKTPDLEVSTRDLTLNPPPHIDLETIGAYYTPEDSRTPEQQQKIKLSDELVDELLAADEIVISSPMWNFSVPSALKAYIDHIVRSGRTFSFRSGSLEGLVKNKKVYVVSASGSVFSSGPFEAFDHLNGYLKHVLGFIGITDITFLRAEGLNDPANQHDILDRIETEIEAL